MTHGILKSLALPVRERKNPRFRELYSKFGLYYEYNDNSKGGQVYEAGELESYLQMSAEGEEFGQVTNYADDFAGPVNGYLTFRIPFPDEDSYLAQNYVKYEVWIRTREDGITEPELNS